MYLFKNSREKIKGLSEILCNPEIMSGELELVWTNGCFDILHKGHVRHLEEASKYAPRLIVGINSDSSVRALKGPDKPQMHEDERAEIVASLECVDYVVIFSELSPVKYISILQPSVYAKGGEYTLDTMNQEEKKAIESYGGRIVFTGDKVNSSSRVIEQIRKGKQQ